MLKFSIILAALVFYYAVIYFFSYFLRDQRELLCPRYGELDGRFEWEKKWHKGSYRCAQIASLLGTSIISLVFIGSMNLSLWAWVIICGIAITYIIFNVLEKIKP